MRCLVLAQQEGVEKEGEGGDTSQEARIEGLAVRISAE